MRFRSSGPSDKGVSVVGSARNAVKRLWSGILAFCLVTALVVPALAAQSRSFETAFCNSAASASTPITGDKSSDHHHDRCDLHFCVMGCGVIAPHSDILAVLSRGVNAASYGVRRSADLRSLRLRFFAARGPPHFFA